MRVVVADTGPLNYLILIEQADILAALFDGVLISEAVRHELTRQGAPTPVRVWMAAPPAWLSIQPETGANDASLQRMGTGEREAVLLAGASKADLILMDDRAGVAAARSKSFTVVGTLSVIDLAARRGLLDVTAAITRLRATSFRCRPDLFDAVLAKHKPPT